jgi:enoyl-CoA hydratase/carnithine racemase
LARPDKLNSFTIEMWREMRELGASLLAEPGELRALVVTGEGRAFSSGIDTSVFTEARDATDLADAAPTRHDDPTVDAILTTQDAYTWLEEAPFATIAAVRGYALGAGLQLALACDLRVLAHGTRVGLLEFKYGIIPDLGGTQRLPRLVGPSKAKELIFTAAQIDAAEAERIGLAEHVVADEELDDAAMRLAEQIAGQPPLAVRAAKRAVNASATVDGVRAGLLVEAEGQAECLGSDDMREAITAFIEQRPPRYSGK